MVIKRIINNILKRSLPDTEKELREFITHSGHKDIISKDKRELIDSVFEIEETLIREIMTPRIDIIACNYNTPIKDVINIINTSAKTKLPVFHNNLDNILGIINGNDILKFVLEDINIKAVEIMRPAYLVPESKSVLSSLREFQKNKVSMAIVIDEYGGVCGLITMEDIIEEIVGEIQDELDKEEFMIKKMSSNTYLVNGKMELDELNELLNTNFDYENINSVGGLIFSELGHIPKENETLKIDSIEFIVIEMIKTRINKVLIRDLRGKE